MILLGWRAEYVSHTPARILMVEDNPGDTFLLRHAFDHHTQDYQLDVLLDGAAAIRFVEEQREAVTPAPCVIVLDWHLPKHDGAAVLEAIRREPILAHVHVVALTTVSPKDELEMYRLGVRLHAPKPTELDGWFTLAGQILEICRGGTATKLTTPSSDKVEGNS